MENKFLMYPLLSNSFGDKLQKLVDSDQDVIAKHLLEANQILKIRNSLNEDELPADIKTAFVKSISGKITDFGRMLTLKDHDFLVSFLPKGCEPEFKPNGNWTTKNRQQVKPGKIAQKIIGADKYANADYEKFVYRLKALWETGGYEIKLVSGEDIRYWYDREHYYSCSSTLGHSCMQHEECQSYFDLYCEQPECQMLIALKNDLLAARALVWTIGDITFLDRVYYIEDSLLNVFINYARNKQWWIRNDNCLLSDGDSQYFKTPADNYEESIEHTFTFKLKRWYDKWPYIDTFRYLDPYYETLSTAPPSNDEDDYYMCSFTNGTYREESYECENCGSSFSDADELLYSEYEEAHGCTDCMRWSRVLEDYIWADGAVFVEDYDYIRTYVPESYIDAHPTSFCIRINNEVVPLKDHDLTEGILIYKTHPEFVSEDE